MFNAEPAKSRLRIGIRCSPFRAFATSAHHPIILPRQLAAPESDEGGSEAATDPSFPLVTFHISRFASLPRRLVAPKALRRRKLRAKAGPALHSFRAAEGQAQSSLVKPSQAQSSPINPKK